MNSKGTTELFTSELPRDLSTLEGEPPFGPESATAGDERRAATERATLNELLATLRRLERTLDEMRGHLETSAREAQHREFSTARLIGSAAQALVIGLLLWALSDWVFRELGQVLVKLAFAGVLQLGALTAFLLARESDRA